MKNDATTSKLTEFSKALGWREEEVVELFEEVNMRIKEKNALVDSLKKKAEIILNDLGIPKESEGFKCMQMAIAMVCENPNLRYGMAIRLFPAVAEKCGVSDEHLEKVLYKVVCDVWNRQHKDALRKYFRVRAYLIDATFPNSYEFILRVFEALNDWELD